MSITFTQQQRDVLSAITNGATENFWQGYIYIRSIVSADSSYEPFVYWLTKASEINSNDRDSEASHFIRGVTRNGFLFEGDTGFDIQGNSELIGQRVVAGILDAGEIPSLEEIIRDDVGAALTEGGQTIAGWGGAFYYWTFPLSTTPGDTVGNAILADKIQYDKFIAVAAKAVSEGMQKFGVGTADQFLSLLDAQLPLSVTAEIVGRIAEVVLGDAPSFAGDPDNIDGYRPTYGLNDEVTEWRYNTPEATNILLTDPVLIAELNARHAYRFTLAEDSAFASPNPDPGLHVAGGLEAMDDDAENLAGVPSGSYASTRGAQIPLAQLDAWYAERFAFTEGAGSAGGGSSYGILSQNLTATTIVVEFGGAVLEVINYNGSNSKAQPTSLTSQEKLEPRLHAFQAAINAAAESTDLSPAESAQIEGAIRASWDAGENPLYDIAAGKIMHYAFEAGGGSAVHLTAGNIGGNDSSSALVGGGGADELTGGTEDDILIARGGNDTLLGGGGADILFGGGGVDTLDGGEGNDVEFGGNGVETFVSGKGIDRLFGGEGDDVFELTYFGRDFAIGGAGNDTFNIDASDYGDMDVIWQDMTQWVPTIVWGGAGSDIINIDVEGSFTVSVLVDPTITEGDILNIDPYKLMYFGWTNLVSDIVILNPDPSDVISVNGSPIGGAAYGMYHEVVSSVDGQPLERHFGYFDGTYRYITSDSSMGSATLIYEAESNGEITSGSAKLTVYGLENGELGMLLAGNGTVYSWKDANGVWQDSTTMAGADWVDNGGGHVSLPTSTLLYDAVS